MSRKKSKPFVPHIYERRISLKNKKPKKIYYIWWLDENGNKISQSTGCTTKADAELYVIDLVKNNLLGKKNADITLQEFAEPFFKEERCPILKDKRARQVTYSKTFAKWTRGQVDRNILPFLGSYKLTKLTPFIIQNWLNDLPSKNKLSNNSCNKQLNYLSQILEVAVLQDLIAKNPCDKVKRLQADTKQRPSFTEEDCKTLFETPWEDTTSYTACLLSACTGARISEVRALKKCNIKDGSIEINHSYGTGGEKRTKNKHARIIPIPTELQKWLAFLSEDRDDNDYLFSLTGSKPIDVKVITNTLYSVMDERGINRDKYKTSDGELPLSFHSFRHFLNTILLGKGIPQPKVRAVLGHLSENSTKTYTNAEAFDFTDVVAIQSSISGDTNGEAKKSKEEDTGV